MAIFILVIFLTFSLVGCGGDNRSEKTAAENLTSVYQLNDKRYVIGFGEGSSAANILHQELPNAKAKSYNDELTGYESVKQGKIDGYLSERIQMQMAIDSGLHGVKLLPDNFHKGSEIAVGISPETKIPDFENKINRFIAELKNSGILPDMVNRWLVIGDETMPDIAPAVNPQYRLRIGTTAVVPPYTYYKGNEVWGFDIELGKRFAAWLGADYEFKVYDYSGVIAAVLSGDVDCIMANLNKTPERMEKIHFSNPIYIGDNTIMVRDKNVKQSNNTLGISTLDDLRRPKLRIGMPIGAIFDKIIDEQYPLMIKMYYNNFADIIEALVNDKIDVAMIDEAMAIDICRDVEGVDYIRQYVTWMDTGFCFAKNERGRQLCDEFNTFWRNEIKKGLKQELFDKWIKGEESGKTLTVPNTVVGRPTVSVITHIYPPFSYIIDEKIVGYDIEVLYRWCEASGYNVDVSIYDSSAVIAALVSDKGDVLCGDITITDERKENITFSDPVCSGGIVALVKKAAAPQNNQNKYTVTGKTLNDLRQSGVKIGMGNGTNFVNVCKQEFPQAEILYVNSYADMALQIKQGKIDAALIDSPSANMMCRSMSGIGYIPDLIDTVYYAAAFPKTDKGAQLCRQFNEFLGRAKADGRLAQMQDIWFGADDSRKVIAPLPADAPNGTLHLASDVLTEPFSYMSNQQVVGYDIAYITEFCREYGYGLKITSVDFSAILPGLLTNVYDLAATGMCITEERKESVLFSDPVYEGGTVAIVKADTDSNQSAASAKQNHNDSSIGTFLKKLSVSFDKTFIRESRWKLILSGIGITILISVLSALLGTLLGFGICLMRLSKNKLLDIISLVYIRILQGTPTVVLLMILFYVVFAKTGLDSVWVAVIGFGLNFAAYVSEMMRTGIEAVDRGQTEAALALGYTKVHAFFRIVFPQAAKHFLPVYRGEFISLVKMTSVVGYIAIQDLTKAGDIIRSRTYEAFFPLITIAVIYFLIAWLLTRVLSVMEK
ncbi:MAG: ABC transporter permease subunit [Spirochaetales bacterium]|nr:ABC transporter permease subunit [Spirochaetales bacterium]